MLLYSLRGKSRPNTYTDVMVDNITNVRHAKWSAKPYWTHPLCTYISTKFGRVVTSVHTYKIMSLITCPSLCSRNLRSCCLTGKQWRCVVIQGVHSDSTANQAAVGTASITSAEVQDRGGETRLQKGCYITSGPPGRPAQFSTTLSASLFHGTRATVENLILSSLQMAAISCSV